MLDFFNAISDSMELSNLSPNKKKKLFGYHEDVEFRDFTVCLGLDFASAYDEVRSDDTILSLLLKIFKNSTHKCYKPIHMRWFFQLVSFIIEFIILLKMIDKALIIYNFIIFG